MLSNGIGSGGAFQPEVSGDFWPHLAPPKQIAIVDIKRLIGRRRFGRRPERGTRQQPALGHFQQAVVSARFAGETQRQPKRFTDRRVNRDA